MKAEQLKSKIRYAIATSIHSNPDNIGFQGYDIATEKCLKIIDDYARIQIEKDRERVKASFEKTMTWGSKQIIDNTPINLD